MNLLEFCIRSGEVLLQAEQVEGIDAAGAVHVGIGLIDGDIGTCKVLLQAQKIKGINNSVAVYISRNTFG